MTDDKDIIRAYSQDRQTYRHNSISLKRKTSIPIKKLPENYYSNRNCPEILSLFALTNRHLDNRKNQIYHSVSNDEHYFRMINYPLEPPSAKPNPDPILENNGKQTKFPRVTPRSTSVPETKFPTLTPRNTPAVDTKNPMPRIKTSVKSTSSSHNKYLQTKNTKYFK